MPYIIPSFSCLEQLCSPPCLCKWKDLLELWSNTKSSLWVHLPSLWGIPSTLFICASVELLNNIPRLPHLLPWQWQEDAGIVAATTPSRSVHFSYCESGTLNFSACSEVLLFFNLVFKKAALIIVAALSETFTSFADPLLWPRRSTNYSFFSGSSSSFRSRLPLLGNAGYYVAVLWVSTAVCDPFLFRPSWQWR